MAEIQGFQVSDILNAGSLDDGKQISLTIQFQGGEKVNFFIPYDLIPNLTMGIQNGAGLAEADRSKKFGSQGAANAAFGFQALTLHGFELGLGLNPNTQKFDVVAHLRAAGGGVLAVGMSPDIAKSLGENLKKTAEEAADQKLPPRS